MNRYNTINIPTLLFYSAGSIVFGILLGWDWVGHLLYVATLTLLESLNYLYVDYKNKK